MEASRMGTREADVAPAPDPTAGRGAMAGWTPADPGPLGLAGFAGTTFMLSLVNAGLVGVQHGAPGGGLLPMVAGLAIAYGGIAQFLAGIWEFRTGNTFGAVAFCSYGAFWISFYFIVHSAAQNTGSEVFSGLGLYLWMWGIFTTYMFVASLRTTGAVALVFLLLAITFIILGIGNSPRRDDERDQRHDQARWVPGHPHRACGLVRLVRRGDQLDLRARPAPGRPAPSLGEPQAFPQRPQSGRTKST